MVAADRGQTSAGKASGSGLNGLTRHLRESNGCQDNTTNGEAQEREGKPATGQWRIDHVDRRRKSDQYGRRICRLRRGSPRAPDRQTFLTRPGWRSAPC